MLSEENYDTCGILGRKRKVKYIFWKLIEMTSRFYNDKEKQDIYATLYKVHV